MKRRPRPLRYVSALTLAFFADSGWYAANWTALAASRSARASSATGIVRTKELRVVPAAVCARAICGVRGLC